MLEVSDLTAGYGGPNVLEDVSLDVESGELVGLLGANNAGKSTLINCISGVLRPRAGTIRFLGEDITRAKPSDIDPTTTITAKPSVRPRIFQISPPSAMAA